MIHVDTFPTPIQQWLACAAALSVNTSIQNDHDTTYIAMAEPVPLGTEGISCSMIGIHRGQLWRLKTEDDLVRVHFFATNPWAVAITGRCVPDLDIACLKGIGTSIFIHSQDKPLNGIRSNLRLQHHGIEWDVTKSTGTQLAIWRFLLRIAFATVEAIAKTGGLRPPPVTERLALAIRSPGARWNDNGFIYDGKTLTRQCREMLNFHELTSDDVSKLRRLLKRREATARKRRTLPSPITITDSVF